MERLLILEDGDARFGTVIDRTETRDDCYAGVVIKWSTYHFQIYCKLFPDLKNVDWEAFQDIQW